MLSAIRFRMSQAVVLAVLAALVTGCAVFAPLHDRALQQAMVRQRLAQETVHAKGLAVSSAEAYQPWRVLPNPKLASLVPPSVRRFFTAAVPSTSIDFMVWPEGVGSPMGSIMWREGACQHVTFVAGSCPSGRNDVAVSTADRANFRWQVGSRVTVGEFIQNLDADSLPRKTMTVTGVYRLRPGPYWFDRPVTGSSGTVQVGSSNPRTDDWLTSKATMAGPTPQPGPGPLQSHGSWLGRRNEVDLRLRDGLVGIDQVLRLGPAVQRFAEAPVRKGDGYGQGPAVQVYSGLPDIAAAMRHGRDQANVTVPLLMLQLGLFLLVVLWLVLQAAVEQRRQEVALARLRGRGLAGARRLLLGELGPVVLAGVPVGVGLALGMSALARHVFLARNPPLELVPSFWWALLAAAVVLAGVTVAAALGVARQPVTALLRQVAERRSGWGVGAAEAVLFALAVAATVGFLTGSVSGPAALIGPAVLALAVGMAASHLVRPVFAGVGRWLLGRGRVAAATSALQLARRPSARRVIVVVTVAAALLTFTGNALAVGARNRTLRAEQAVGAPLVARTQSTDLRSVRSVLDHLDPRHRELTPVVFISPPGLGGSTTEAVVPSSFRQVALFPGLDAAGIDWTKLAADPRQQGRVPALVTGTPPSDFDRGRFTGSGLDELTVPMRQVAALPYAPGAPPDTVLVDLDRLAGRGAQLAPLADLQVWFAHPDTHLLARLKTALHARGVSVVSTSSTADLTRRYGSSAPSWGLQLAVVVGAAALLVAALVLLVVVATTWRSRRYDDGALRMAGMPVRTLTRATIGELCAPVVLAVLLGAACGTAGAHVAMPTVPIFLQPPAVPIEDLSLSWPAILVATVAALVLLTGLALAAARALTRRSDLALLRGTR